MREAYIVTSVRTPGCRRGKGAFAFTRPEDLLKSALNGLMERTPGVEKKDVEDILVGCAFPEAEQGLNIGRVIAQIAEFPDSTCGATVNRFCASGLEAIALQAMRIMAGYCDVAIGAGLESMSIVPMGGNLPRPHPEQALKSPEVYMSMGMTAENVANRYKITREMQDEWGFHSQAKAAQAQKAGKFKEIVPTEAVRFVEKDGITVKETFIQDFDDGVRPTTIEGLAKLRPAFAAMGSVTAGNSSQTTDGAACSLIMSGEAVKKFGVKPLAKLVVYTTAGCRADEMGVGPAYAIPKALKMAGLKVEDIGLWEVNEAFASQCIYSFQQLGLYEKKELWVSDSDKRIINVNGGAIALGHPLGCTGAKLCAQLTNEMRERGVKYGVESMCIGGGMGAAAVFELCD
ncbi:MAG TPA: thiolase family protein [Desulfomonilia bacterium]|nr:thiolase family protein [Deltaproteobacteria bacterium]HPD20428.1 thiolase family protein [Deltaproteobacteria bacterium]HRS55262.1 thiolase family protein [Desulfomonilia bacterium]HRV34810.1 thiolase family protein [Desulfomonilia bacterium]